MIRKKTLIHSPTPLGRPPQQLLTGAEAQGVVRV